MARENVGENEARKMIVKIDEERRKWTRRLYGVDPWDPDLYDLVICIDSIKVEGAVDLICNTASQESFKLTADVRQRLADLALACKVKSALLDLDHNLNVTSSYGNVLVYTKTDDRKARKLDEKVQLLSGQIEGIHNIEVRAGEPRSSADA
jgi:hypothetical protein